MPKRLRREESALILVSFWGAILAVRNFIFYYSKGHPAGPMLIINGFHLHHYISGAFLILISAIIYSLAGRRRGTFTLLLFGAGLGLMLDEFSSWFNFKVNDYWQIENFLAIIISGVLLSSFLLFLTNKEEREKISLAKIPHKNPQNPLVSLVIPAFNEEKFLAKTLQSVLDQDLNDFELIVVDNNSHDKTAEVAKDFGARVIFEPRQGVGFARQRGFTEARGKIIATTDADTIFPVNWLSRIIGEFKKDKDLVAFGGLYTFYSGSLMARFSAFYFLYPVFVLDRLLCGGWTLPGVNFAVRKSAFLKVGGFNTELKLCEDADISQRLKKIGKVFFDHNFLVQTSGRRFRHGLFHGMITYLPNGVIRMLFNRYKFNKLPTVRTEESLISKLPFLPLVLLAAFLFSLFYSSSPSVAQAKEVKSIRKRLVFAREAIKKRAPNLKISNPLKNKNLRELRWLHFRG